MDINNLNDEEIKDSLKLMNIDFSFAKNRDDLLSLVQGGQPQPGDLLPSPIVDNYIASKLHTNKILVPTINIDHLQQQSFVELCKLFRLDPTFDDFTKKRVKRIYRIVSLLNTYYLYENTNYSDLGNRLDRSIYKYQNIDTTKIGSVLENNPKQRKTVTFNLPSDKLSPQRNGGQSPFTKPLQRNGGQSPFTSPQQSPQRNGGQSPFTKPLQRNGGQSPFTSPQQSPQRNGGQSPFTSPQQSPQRNGGQSNINTRKFIRLTPSKFQGPKKIGDFTAMLKGKYKDDYQRALFVFNDNEEQQKAYFDYKSGMMHAKQRACNPGSGNAEIRDFQCTEPQRALGIPTGSYDRYPKNPGYQNLAVDKKHIDRSLTELKRLLLSGFYDEVIYSADNSGALASKIFNVAPDVKLYIQNGIKRVVDEVNSGH
jgi:hypothetical protein